MGANNKGLENLNKRAKSRFAPFPSIICSHAALRDNSQHVYQYFSDPFTNTNDYGLVEYRASN